MPAVSLSSLFSYIALRVGPVGGFTEGRFEREREGKKQATVP